MNVESQVIWSATVETIILKIQAGNYTILKKTNSTQDLWEKIKRQTEKEITKFSSPCLPPPSLKTSLSLQVLYSQLKLHKTKNMLQVMVSICQQHKHSELC